LTQIQNSTYSSEIELKTFLASGREENSPFLTSHNRHWSQNLSLKVALGCLQLWTIALSTLLLSSPIATITHQLILLLIYLLIGTPTLIETIESLIARELNIDVLMGLSAFAAALIGSPREGALLLILFKLSEAMEDFVLQRANSTLGSLEDILPKQVHLLVSNGRIAQRSIKDIVIGQKILVKAGERVPLDGTLIEGPRSFNMAHMTGEPLPITKNSGEEVSSGAIPLDSLVHLCVTRTYLNSTLHRIYGLVAQAQASRPHLQTWLDTFSHRYSLGIILLTCSVALLLPIILPAIPYVGQEGSIYRALSFMIAASPCALIIATPIAYLSAISAAASRGILLKGGAVVDSLTQCHSAAFDKTGTLTTGILRYSSHWLPHSQQLHLSSEVAALAYGNLLSSSSHHPISRALSLAAEASKSSLQDSASVRNLLEHPGKGVSGEVWIQDQWIPAALGRLEFISSHLSKEMEYALQQKLEQVDEKTKSFTLLALGGEAAAFYFDDSLRPQIGAVMKELRENFHLNLHLLTGDTKVAAQQVAKQLEMPHYHGSLLPEEKLAHVQAIAEKEGLIMVGDGINDAPALARATVGISLGGVGSSTAIEAADIVFLKDELTLLPWLLRTARLVKKIIKQNLTLAILVIVGASCASLFGLIPLWIAVLLHEGGTVLVGLNGLRILRSR
jgi:heavy metal translocating P-type ATPase